MTWFRRLIGEDPVVPPDGAAAEPDDSPAALRARIDDLVTRINAAAGRLPTFAVVGAREVCDRVLAVVDAGGNARIDIYAAVQINGIVGDYLPTTLRAYLALDPAQTSRPGRSGRTPEQGLREQIDALVDAADQMLAAARAQDADALESQGNFLRTKFSGSDLDL